MSVWEKHGLEALELEASHVGMKDPTEDLWQCQSAPRAGREKGKAVGLGKEDFLRFALDLGLQTFGVGLPVTVIA